MSEATPTEPFIARLQSGAENGFHKGLGIWVDDTSSAFIALRAREEGDALWSASRRRASQMPEIGVLVHFAFLAKRLGPISGTVIGS